VRSFSKYLIAFSILSLSRLILKKILVSEPLEVLIVLWVFGSIYWNTFLFVGSAYLSKSFLLVTNSQFLFWYSSYLVFKFKNARLSEPPDCLQYQLICKESNLIAYLPQPQSVRRVERHSWVYWNRTNLTPTETQYKRAAANTVYR